MNQRARFVGLVIIVIIALAKPSFAQGPITFQYFYDELGQLVRVVDSAGNVVTYTYDAVGNILRVDRGTVSQLQPQITGIDPPVGRAPSNIQVTISGNNLLAGVVTTDNPGIVVSTTRAADTAVRATFAIAASARLGTTNVAVNTNIGSATTLFTIDPSAFSPNISPSVVSVAPNGGTAPITVGLSRPDTFPTPITLRIGDPFAATAIPSQLTIPAGQTSATAVVTGQNAGFTSIIADTGSGTAQAAVIVAAPFSGPVFALGPMVSVGLQPGPPSFHPLQGPLVSVGLLAGPPSFRPFQGPLVSVGLLIGPPSFSPLQGNVVSVLCESSPPTMMPLLSSAVSVKLASP